MNDYLTQFNRLKRHYESSRKTYDKGSFLDLAHILRVWSEMSDTFDIHFFDKRFKVGILTKGMKNILNGSEYFYTFLPDGVTTSFSLQKQLVGINTKSEKFYVGGMLEIKNEKRLTLFQYYLIERNVSKEEIKILSDKSDQIPLQYVNFQKYLNSPAIHFNFLENKHSAITNKNLIKRIANEYQASHAYQEGVIDNSFSKPVERLMSYTCMGLPLPYFILLHIAKNIVELLDPDFN